MERSAWVENFWKQNWLKKIDRVYFMSQDKIEELKSCSDEREIESLQKQIEMYRRFAIVGGILNTAGSIATTNGIWQRIAVNILTPQEANMLITDNDFKQAMEISNLSFSFGAGCGIAGIEMSQLMSQKLKMQNKKARENEKKPAMEDTNNYLMFNHDYY